MEISTVSRAVKIGLHACGIWPYLLPSTVLSFVRYVMIHYYTDSFSSNFMVGLSSAMTYSLLLIKLVIYGTFSDILQMMAVDWQNCDLIECCLRITMNRARLSHRVSNWLIDLQLGAVVLYSCGILTGNAGHILKMKLSFVMNTFPVYALVIIFEFCHLSICPAGYLIVNSNIVTLCTLALNRCLLRLVDESLPKNMILTVDGITLKMLIMKHQRIIAFTQKIENFYTYRLIGTPGGFSVLVRSILYYFVMNLEAFIYCFAGILEYQESDCTSRDPEITETLSITIGKVMDLSLERLTSIMKASASYYLY
ncbi:Odorant receptor 418 [Nylanderia fulva]|uniref:Odorant receptor 418 n=1 Tax=Nylanderia fulva TaxID=613905 RepID=A0A6G1LPQ7_9HYME|nr:Odorant receptor 418 [Nylanderia fulva]